MDVMFETKEISSGTELMDSESEKVMFRGLEEVPVILSWNCAEEPTAIGVTAPLAVEETEKEGAIESLTNPTWFAVHAVNQTRFPSRAMVERVPDAHLVDGDLGHRVLRQGRLVGYLGHPVRVMLVEPDGTPVGQQVVGEGQRELRVRRGWVERPVFGMGVVGGHVGGFVLSDPDRPLRDRDAVGAEERLVASHLLEDRGRGERVEREDLPVVVLWVHRDDVGEGGVLEEHRSGVLTDGRRDGVVDRRSRRVPYHPDLRGGRGLREPEVVLGVDGEEAREDAGSHRDDGEGPRRLAHADQLVVRRV